MIKTKINLTAKEEQEAIESVYQEWRIFEVPKPISDRINELWWDGKSEKDSVEILIEEFDAEKCYVDKCYFFSEVNEFIREEIASYGGFYNCQFCKESCVPVALK